MNTLLHCPTCDQDATIVSEDRLYGYQLVAITYAHGRYTAEFAGATDIDWESAHTERFLYACCHTPLIGTLAQKLERLLSEPETAPDAHLEEQYDTQQHWGFEE